VTVQALGTYPNVEIVGELNRLLRRNLGHVNAANSSGQYQKEKDPEKDAEDWALPKGY
jgi:hypothetical protein